MSNGYKIQNRTRDYLKDLNIRVSKKKSRYRRDKGIELNDLIQTKKPDDFTSSREVQKYKKDMERFLQRETQYEANDKGAIFTRESVQQFKNHVKRVNKLKEKELKKIEKLMTRVKNVDLNYTVKDYMKRFPKMFQNLQPISDSLNRFSSEKELRKSIKETFDKGFFRGNFIRRADLIYRKNFLQTLETHFGLERSARLRSHIKNMSLDDFMKVYYQSVGTIDINYVYHNEDDLLNKLTNVERTFGL